jgi:hypothetical protein
MSPSQAGPATRTTSHRWWALGLIAAAQFMVIMDTSIIGVALPEMQADLGFAPQDLSWVFNAYVVAFGGLLLLGGRLSDLLGARRVFAAGWVVLLVGSVVAGVAQNVPVEIVGRAVQGAGAALIAPSALTLLMVLFGSTPKELTRALALYGAAAPAGGTAGVFLGGVITEYASWPWVFLLNVPIAVAVLAAVPAVMPAVPGSHGSHDWLGGATVTGGLAAGVYTIVRAPEVGWGSAETLLIGLVERRIHDFEAAHGQIQQARHAPVPAQVHCGRKPEALRHQECNRKQNPRQYDVHQRERADVWILRMSPGKQCAADGNGHDRAGTLGQCLKRVAAKDRLFRGRRDSEQQEITPQRHQPRSRIAVVRPKAEPSGQEHERTDKEQDRGTNADSHT